MLEAYQAPGSQGTTFQIWWRLMQPANMPTKIRTTLFLRSVSVSFRTLQNRLLSIELTQQCRYPTVQHEQQPGVEIGNMLTLR